MGSFNAVCAISNLPIIYRDRVLYILLMDTHADWRGEKGCYVDDFYTPYAIPIRGTYDDYGRIVDVDESDPLVQWLRVALREIVIPVEEGENPCHDKAVTKEMFDKDDWFEQLQQRVGRGRFNTTGHYRTSKRPISAIMVREDVYETLAGLTWERWHDNAVISTEAQVAQYLNLPNRDDEFAEERIDFIQEWAADNSDRPDAAASMRRTVIGGRRREEQQQWGWKHYTLLTDIYESWVLGADYRHVDGAPLPTDTETLTRMCTEIAKLYQVAMQMSMVNRPWIAQTMSSGQHRDSFKPHIRFHRMLADLAREELNAPYDSEDREWSEARQAEFWALHPPMRAYEYNERTKISDMLDVDGNQVYTGDFGDKTKYGTYVCLYLYKHDDTRWTWAMYNAGEWESFEAGEPHADVLRYCKPITPPPEV